MKYLYARTRTVLGKIAEYGNTGYKTRPFALQRALVNADGWLMLQDEQGLTEYN